ESTWASMQGRDALKITWDEGAAAALDSAKINAMFEAAGKSRGAVARADGDADKALAGAKKKLAAVYETPYLAHAPMEPMSAVAPVRRDGCDLWVPTQSPGNLRDVAAGITGLPKESVNVHLTYLGGGFGRRSEDDFTVEAVTLSKNAGAP